MKIKNVYIYLKNGHMYGLNKKLIDRLYSTDTLEHQKSIIESIYGKTPNDINIIAVSSDCGETKCADGLFDIAVASDAISEVLFCFE